MTKQHEKHININLPMETPGQMRDAFYVLMLLTHSRIKAFCESMGFSSRQIHAIKDMWLKNITNELKEIIDDKAA